LSQESTLLLLNERTEAIYPSQTNTRYRQTLLSLSLTIGSTTLSRSKQRDPRTAYHLKKVFRPSPLPSRNTQATLENPPRDASVSDEMLGFLQQGKAATEAHEQEAAPRESATAAERNTDSAAAATLEEATWHDAGGEAKRDREEARLRHELER
jgi:hypothetical protein